jgi:uncharacterized protein CbrC (UPF0167 family)
MRLQPHLCTWCACAQAAAHVLCGFLQDELRKQLQQVQLQSAVKKLSERTCVQIVSQLVEAGQLEVA